MARRKARVTAAWVRGVIRILVDLRAARRLVV